MIVRDVNNREECPACGFHPDVNRAPNLEGIEQHAPETIEELRARHDAQVAAGTDPWVIRHTRDVGPGERKEPVDWEARCLAAEVEIERLRKEG